MTESAADVYPTALAAAEVSTKLLCLETDRMVAD